MKTAIYSLLAISIFAAAAAGPAPAPPVVRYKDVKPIFAKRCTGCHTGPYAKEGLDLSTYAGIMKGRRQGKVVVAKKPAASLLYMVISGKAKPSMPPKSPPLPAAELKKINAWITAGAKN